jgi:nucleoside-diphosphate-sugar epimerase
MAVIAITGTSGFIGGYLQEVVACAGHRPLAITRPALADPERALVGADVLIHAAGRAHVLREDASDPALAFHEVNVVLTERLLAAARRAGVRRFVFLSSAGVLGNVTSELGVTDDSPPRPYDEYSRSKLAAEQILGAAEGDSIETVIVRPPVVYGPGARGNFGRILHAVRSGWPLPAGALHAPRSMVGLRNLSDFLMLAALHPRAPGRPMLVSDAETISVRELALGLGRALQRRPLLLPIPVPLLSMMLALVGKRADIARLTQPCVVRGERAREALGWQPPHTLDEELAWAVRPPSRTS